MNMKKYLVVAVILLFIGLAVAPSINANLEKLNEESTFVFEENYDMLELSCRYFTLSRVNEINREVSVEDAEHLFRLMDGSDNEAIATKLEFLELIPKSMSISEVKEIIDRKHKRENEESFVNILKNILPRNNDSKWSENFLCDVQGEGVDSYYITPIGLTLHMLLLLSSIIITLPFTILSKLCWLIYDLLDNANILTFLSYFFFELGLEFSDISNIVFMMVYFILERGQILNQVKISSLAYVKLYDACNYGFPYMNVTGLGGNWTLHNKRIDLIMVGFTGLWISIKDQVQVPGCNFRGNCLYATARELDDWVETRIL